MLQWQQYHAGESLALVSQKEKKMSDKKVVKENSNASSGYGPGKEVRPGANIVPRSWWISTAKASPNKK